jgi:hypothetical protein
MGPLRDLPEPAHLCPACTSELVQLVACRRTSPWSWEVRLRCPECGARRAVVLDRVSLAVLADIQAEATALLAEWVRRLDPDPSPAELRGDGREGTDPPCIARVRAYPRIEGTTADAPGTGARRACRDPRRWRTTRRHHQEP